MLSATLLLVVICWFLQKSSKIFCKTCPLIIVFLQTKTSFMLYIQQEKQFRFESCQALNFSYFFSFVEI